MDKTTIDACRGAIELLEQDPKTGLTNKEWIDFLSEQFDISRRSAKEMLHLMMAVKRSDNFKKQFLAESEE